MGSDGGGAGPVGTDRTRQLGLTVRIAQGEEPAAGEACQSQAQGGEATLPCHPLDPAAIDRRLSHRRGASRVQSRFYDDAGGNRDDPMPKGVDQGDDRNPS